MLRPVDSGDDEGDWGTLDALWGRRCRVEHYFPGVGNAFRLECAEFERRYLETIRIERWRSGEDATPEGRARAQQEAWLKEQTRKSKRHGS